MGNYVQHPVINYNGKEYEKVHVFIVIYSHCTIQQKLTQYYKPTIFQLKIF